MTDFFGKIYTNLSAHPQRRWRRRGIVIFLANTILPVYYRITSAIHTKNLTDTQSDIILSFTSFPKRINKLWLTIESLSRQTVKPGKAILYLSGEEFTGIKSLPNSLQRLQKRGLTIEFRPGNLRSHKKYYYAVTEHPNATVITVDDDVFYNSHTIERLVSYHKKFPGTVCANFATTILTNPDGTPIPYDDWKTVLPQPGIPSYNALPIGIGGVLYPPGSLNKTAFDTNDIIATALHADDLWLKAASLILDRKVVKTDMNSSHLPVRIKGDTPLWHINMLDGGNDRYIKNVRDYFLQKTGKDIIAISQQNDKKPNRQWRTK